MTQQDDLRALRGHDDQLRTYAYYLSAGQTDEVLRDAYLDALADAAPIGADSGTRDRLFGLVHAQSADRLRSTPPASDPPPDASTPDRLGAAVRAVPFAERSALLLVVHAGMSTESAARLLGVTPPTVSADVAAARDAIRARVPDLDVDSDGAVRSALASGVPPTGEPFWADLERRAGRAGATALATSSVLAAGAPGPSRPPRWPIVAGVIGALAVIGGVIWLIVAGSDDDDATDVTTPLTELTEPTTPETEPTTPATEPTTPPTEPTTPATEPTTPATEPTTPPTEPTTPATEPTTPATEPTTPEPVTNDRGAVPFAAGESVAELTGTIGGEDRDRWTVEPGADQFLVLRLGEEPPVSVDVAGPDGTPPSEVAATRLSRVLSIVDGGTHDVQIASASGEPVDYGVGVAIGEADRGYLLLERETETERIALATTSCDVADDVVSITATYDDAEQSISIVLGPDASASSVEWSGTVSSSGAVIAIVRGERVSFAEGTVEVDGETSNFEVGLFECGTESEPS